jgi:sulfur carrier protein ThiS
MHISDGSTVANVISAAGIPRSDVKIVFVNGKLADTGKSLVDNDNVTLAPAVGGM